MKQRQQSTHTRTYIDTHNRDIQQKKKKKKMIWGFDVRDFVRLFFHRNDWRSINIYDLIRIFENDLDDVPFVLAIRSRLMSDLDLTMFAFDRRSP